MIQNIESSRQKYVKCRTSHLSNLCVSMFIPTAEPFTFRRKFVELWNEAWTAAESMYSIRECEEVFSQLQMKEALSRLNPEFATLSIFASRGAVHFVNLEIKMEPRVVVDQVFYVKPLEPRIMLSSFRIEDMALRKMGSE